MVEKLMHCDLKSSNVLLDQNWNVKLCDFGLSRINKKIENKVNKGARIGTLNWMAPEIRRGEPYQEKADVYSFRMILWEIITQQIPYEGFSQTQIIGSVGYGQDQQSSHSTMINQPRNDQRKIQKKGLILLILLMKFKKDKKQSQTKKISYREFYKSYQQIDIFNKFQMNLYGIYYIRQLIDFFE